MTLAVQTWNTTTINGNTYLVISTAQFMIPLDWDPSSNMFIAVAAPDGGLGNFPALVAGAPGAAAQISPTVIYTPLQYSDPTPDSASFTAIGSNTWQLSLSLHDGAPGAAGTNILHTASDLTGTAVASQIIIVNAGANGFQYAPQLVGNRYIPATILSAPSGNPLYTLCSVTIPAQLFDYRPVVSGYCIVTGTGTDLQADLICRLNNATSGNEVGRATQSAGQYPPCHVLSSGPPPGSADSFDRVTAGNTATIYFNVERQSGASTFTTSSATTRFNVRVAPIGPVP